MVRSDCLRLLFCDQMVRRIMHCLLLKSNAATRQVVVLDVLLLVCDVIFLVRPDAHV